MRKNKIFNHIRCHYPDAYQFIENYFNWPNNTKNSVKIFWILNGITKIPKCISCGNDLNINQLDPRTGKYRLHCSHYCGCHSEHAKTQYKKTCLERYGAEHNMQSKKGLAEYSDSIRQKYGTEYTFQNKDIQDKAKATNFKKYGNEIASKAQVIKDKISKANLEKSESEKAKIQLKARITKLHRYGNENFVNPKKAKSTCMKRYGVNSVHQLQSYRQKAADVSRKRSYYNILMLDVHDIPCFSYDEYCKRASDADYMLFKCRKCGNTFLSKHYDGTHKHCQHCYPASNDFEEKEITKFIQTIANVKVIENTRTIISPLELDIYIPEKDIAIEFDGLYWHSENSCKLDANYHLHKTELCEEKGIQLIHVFENEWLTKQPIVKSRIKNLLGVYDKTVFARKCTVKEVDSVVSRQFQDENHIQGAVNAKVNLGLFFNEELISLMTFGKCRFDKKHEWELLRFCNKLGYHVPGGAGKLLKHFERNFHPKSLVSYADRRWSKGKLYEALGFKLDHISPPNYWYWKNIENLQSRIKFQKHKLKNLLEKFDESKSEVENMKDNGYHRIYDCGNLVFEKTYNQIL